MSNGCWKKIVHGNKLFSLTTNKNSVFSLTDKTLPNWGSQTFPIHSWFISPYARVVLEVGGAEGLVSETISWMASRSLSRWSGFEIPISRWISVSDKADIIAPDLTLARHAATYQAGIPTHSSSQATMVGPFQSAKGVPAFMASSSSSCLEKAWKLSNGSNKLKD